jgi:spore coat polysaccharide biosynthesis protein SpsF (cytidylyltransferase family)
MMRLGIIIQARLHSTRLPLKIGRLIKDNDTLIDCVVNNIREMGYPVYIATVDDESHRQFFKNFSRKNVDIFFGEENDVLKRFADCADKFELTSVARVCGDNPFFNTHFLEVLLSEWSEQFDYATYFNSSSVPAMKTHYGMFGEIIKVSSLKSVGDATPEAYYHEHVTPFFYEKAERFNVLKLKMPEPFWTGLPLRLTLDTENDLENARRIAKHVPFPQKWESIITFCEQNGLLDKMEKEINSNVK